MVRSLKKCNMNNQRGVVLPLVTIAMLVLIAMTGLAIDLGHVYLNQTRLQNAVDAAALSGGKTLSASGDSGQARIAAETTFTMHLVGELAGKGIKPEVRFSTTLREWEDLPPGMSGMRYVRVNVEAFNVPTYLIQVLPGVASLLTVNASAVSGPIPLNDDELCDLVPIVVCSHGIEDDGKPDVYYGYNAGQIYPLKQNDKFEMGDWEVGTGNFHLLDAGSGGKDVKYSLAAGDMCIKIGDKYETDTETGSKTGPVKQGLNTRFGLDHPELGDQYPSDTDTDATTYSKYEGNGRRVIAIPIAQCTAGNGKETITIAGFGCFFLTQPTDGKQIAGEFVGECNASGTLSEDPSKDEDESAPYKIILYNDPISSKS